MAQMNREQRRKAQKNAKHNARLDGELQLHARIAFDAACIAANDVFNMGPARAMAFRSAYEKAYNEILDMIVDDDATYAFSVLDRRLEKIAGENFTPWEIRYSELFRHRVKPMQVQQPVRKSLTAADQTGGVSDVKKPGGAEISPEPAAGGKD